MLKRNLFLLMLALVFALVAGCSEEVGDIINSESEDLVVSGDQPCPEYVGTSADSINALGKMAYEEWLKQNGGKEAHFTTAAGMCIQLHVPYYSQRDNNWRWEKLGHSRTSTIDRYGCHLTCVSMMYAKWGDYSMNPKNLNNWAKSHGAFSGDLINAHKAIQKGACRRLRYISGSQIISHLLAGHPVVIHTDQYGSHFTVIYGFDGQRFWVKDPYQSDWRYQNQPLRGNLYRENGSTARAIRVYGY